MSMREFEHDGTEQIVCPHCGHVHSDSWEFSGQGHNDGGDAKCNECGKPFHWERNIIVLYGTSKL